MRILQLAFLAAVVGAALVSGQKGGIPSEGQINTKGGGLQSALGCCSLECASACGIFSPRKNKRKCVDLKLKCAEEAHDDYYDEYGNRHDRPRPRPEPYPDRGGGGSHHDGHRPNDGGRPNGGGGGGRPNDGGRPNGGGGRPNDGGRPNGGGGRPNDGGRPNGGGGRR